MANAMAADDVALDGEAHSKKFLGLVRNGKADDEQYQQRSGRDASLLCFS